MANRPQQTAPRKHSSPARAEPAIKRKPAARSALSGLVAELKALSARGGSAFGEAYARAASSVLKELERLEDVNAARRFHQRAQAGATSKGARLPTPAAPIASSPEVRA